LLSRAILVFLVAGFSAVACSPPPVENIYRKNGTFPGGLNVPVAFLVSEWGGKARVMASGWMIEGADGFLFSAKHFTDTFMNDVIELGSKECKAFLAGRVYDCIVVRVPPLRDAVILKMVDLPDLLKLPKPYKINGNKLKVGDTVFIQGFHPHPLEITKSNMAEGIEDLVIPIFKNFYQIRIADDSKRNEVVFDNLKAVVVDLADRIKINNKEPDLMADLKYEANTYLRLITAKNHKFSFGGLSGGVVVKINKNGETEVVGIITAEKPVRLESDKREEIIDEAAQHLVVDTIYVTPIESVKDLYEYARRMR